MKNSSLKIRIIEKFGENFYRHTFKKEVESARLDIVLGRFSYKRYNRFFYKRIFKENGQVILKFRKRNYYKTLFSRIYKEHGEHLLREFKDSDEYLEMLNEKKQKLPPN